MGAVNLGLRVLMELGIVAGFAFWGAHTGEGTVATIALGVGAPLVAFGFWGAIDFHQAGRAAEPLRLTQELVVSGLAALAWYEAGQQGLGLALGALSIVYHALVYLSGARLLQPGRQPAMDEIAAGS
jgi:hypothetical protein